MARILFTEKTHPAGPALLEAAGHEVVHTTSNDKENLRRELALSDAVVVRIADIVEDVLCDATHMKVVSAHGVGVDNVDLDYCRAHNIPVTIASGNSISVAEHALALMLSLAKRIVPVSADYRRIGFEAKLVKDGIELNGKTVGIIGLGRIGKHLATMCHAIFGTTVLGYDPYLKEAPEGVELVSDIDDLFRRCDVVSINVLLNDSTYHLVNADRLKMMGPNSILINCARGPIVDEAALIAALQAGEIGGAGLDVTEVEPLDPASPLFQMDNVIVTPHFAPHTVDCAIRVAELSCQNVLDIMDGKRPQGQIVG